MKLLLNTKDKKFVKKFIPEILKEFIINIYRANRCKKLNDYLKSINTNYNVKTALIYIIDNLKYGIEKEYSVLTVDKNKTLPNTKINLDSLVKLITYGTIDIKGYDIFLRALDFVAKNINSIKTLYISKIKKKGE
jgi:hypothetical protein